MELRRAGEEHLVAIESVLVLDDDGLAANHVGRAVQQQRCGDAAGQRAIDRLVVVVEGVFHHHLRRDRAGGFVDVAVERHVRVRIDDARASRICRRRRSLCTGGSGDGRAEGGDLAVFHVNAAVLDAAVRRRQQGRVLDDEFVLAAVRWPHNRRVAARPLQRKQPSAKMASLRRAAYRAGQGVSDVIGFSRRLRTRIAVFYQLRAGWETVFTISEAFEFERNRRDQRAPAPLYCVVKLTGPGHNPMKLFRSLNGCRSYHRAELRPDVVAGIALAGLLVPEAMGYAGIAGLPPQAGLYATVFGLLAYAIFGSSRQLVVSPTSASSAILAATVAPLAAADPEQVHGARLGGHAGSRRVVPAGGHL